jgi:predicted transcriptional regulator
MSSTLKAIVQGGRVIIEDVDYPDGTELEIAIVGNNEMSDEERAKLDAALESGLKQMEAGNTTSAEEVIASLRARNR